MRLFYQLVCFIGSLLMLMVSVVIMIAAMVGGIDQDMVTAFLFAITAAMLATVAASALCLKSARQADLGDVVDRTHRESLSVWTRFFPLVGAGFVFPFLMTIATGSPNEKFFWALGSGFVVANCLLWLAPHVLDRSGDYHG